MLKEEFLRLFEIRGIAWERMAKWFAAMTVGFILLIVFVSPWKVLAFFIGCIILALVYARPTWALALLAVWLPFEPFVLKFVPDELFVYAKYFSEGVIYVLLGAV